MLKIKKFIVQRLHDVYTYELDFSDGNSDLSILYGDNGSGKTTILKLLYHILSSAGDKGHLTAATRIPFHSAQVTLNDGTVVSVKRDSPPAGYPVHFMIERPGKASASYWFVPERSRSGMAEEAVSAELEKAMSMVGSGSYRHILEPAKIRNIRESTLERYSESAHAAYCDALKSLDIAIYFLGTDRRILSDTVDPWAFVSASARDPAERPEDQISNLRAAYLRDALQRGGRHLNKQIIRASNIGSKNINDIYAEIFRRILKQESTPTESEPERIRSLLAELRWIQRRQRRFVKLGLSPDLDVASFITDLTGKNSRTLVLLEKVLVPFVATLRARLDAMEPIRESVDTFLNSLNSFFSFKSIEYMPSSGFQILGPLGDSLDVKQLSSGEQQLLLIFCSVLASSESPNIFIIDEPEISLNVKWQRDLLSTLGKITKGSEHQMLISTHSIELLTQHSEAVVVLDPVISSSKKPVYESESLE